MNHDMHGKKLKYFFGRSVQLGLLYSGTSLKPKRYLARFIHSLTEYIEVFGLMTFILTFFSVYWLRYIKV